MSEVTYSIEVEQDDMELVRGNAMASGDPKVDEAVENEILTRMGHGDVWAWALVKVTATLATADGVEFEGHTYIGGCSYKDEADFRADGTFEDMKREARDELERELRAAIATGHAAERALAALLGETP